MYQLLTVEEQRYVDNIENTFSVKQIAYIYLFDPLGIEFHMKTKACDDKDTMSGEFLTFKDEVYEAIFGDSERSRGQFYFKIVDGKPCYGVYSGYKRMDVYSNAEVLFGFHTIIDWDFSKFLSSVLEGLFEWITEDSVIGTGIEIYQTLFHAGGILGACSDQASSYVTNYVQESLEDEIKDRFGDKAKKAVHWAITLTSIVAEAALDAFIIPNPQDITIYNKVNTHPEFLTVIEGYDHELSIEEIIDKVNQN